MNTKEKLVLKLPLIQAPLTGYPKQGELAVEISKNGALGLYSTDFQTLTDIEKDIKAIQKKTNEPFAVLINLAESENNIDLADRSSTNFYLKPAYQALKIKETEAPEFPDVNTICKTVAGLRPPVLVFQNGIPADAFIEHCQRSKIITLAIASNSLEAIAIEHSQIDGILLQGIESAGIHSKFENEFSTPSYPLTTLLHHAKKHTTKPLIAWGDCQTAEESLALLQQGVKAIVLDVPFWTVNESPIPSAYRNALKAHNEMITTTSTVWNGQPAQVLQNALTRAEKTNIAKTLPIDKQKRLLKPVIDAAIKQKNADYLPLWAGLCATNIDRSLVDMCDEYIQKLEPFLLKDAL